MRRFVTILIIATYLLTGCASVDERLEKTINASPCFEEDSDYQEYLQLSQSGQLNQDGIYREADIISVSTSLHPDGQVHVTFAENRYLKIRYYANAELTKPINQYDCYLNPGDAIFASVESRNSISNLYDIAKYIIKEYDTEGNVKKQTIQIADSSEVYLIPQNFSGSELAIIPIGKYPDRELLMRAFYIDDEGQEKNLANAGQWTINDENCEGNHASISPIKPYALKYEFDKKNYFFVSSTPNCFTDNPNSVGFVEFWEADPMDDDIAYSVQLHPYLSLSVLAVDKATIAYNGGEAETVRKGKKWSTTDLKYGDRIVIETAGDLTLFSGDFWHVNAERDPISGGYRYTLTIVQNVDKGVRDVLYVNEYISLTLPYNGRHGTCTYKLDGKSVSGTVTMQLSQKLEMTYTITDSEYKFGDNSVFGEVWNWGQDLVGNMTQTRAIPLTAEMNNTTINPENWFAVVKKGS